MPLNLLAMILEAPLINKVSLLNYEWFKERTFQAI